MSGEERRMGIEVLGTGHILKRSVEEVEEKIRRERPEIIALELDRGRFCGLLKNFSEGGRRKSWWKEIKEGGGLLPLFSFLLGGIQKKLGEIFGVSPGSEMMAAVKGAREIGSKIVLIDREIGITMNHLLTMPLRERMKLVSLRKIKLKKGNLSMDNIDDLLRESFIEELMGEVKENLPQFYASLVDERDEFMAYNLIQLQRHNPNDKILAVVGAGHKKGVGRYLKMFESEGLERVNLDRILKKENISFFQIFSLFVIIFIAFIIIEISFLWSKK